MKYLSVTFALLLCGLLGFGNSQDNAASEDVLNKLSGVAEANGLNTSAIPVETAMNVIKQKCEKNGGPDAFENFSKAQENVMNCMKSLINISQLQADMEKYKPTGDLDIVFKEYCRKIPIYKNCVTNFTDAIEPCLEDREKESKKVVLNITDSVLDFVCYKEGDRIAIFISAGGPECFEERQTDIQDCLNSTFSSYVPPTTSPGGLPAIESLPALVFGNTECNDIVKLQGCMVKSLEKCSDPTPANIVDSIFNFILRVTPCQNILNAEKTALSDVRNSADSTFKFISILSVALVFLHFL